MSNNENKDNITFNCIICNQDFKTESTLENHKNTQKHFVNVKLQDIVNKNKSLNEKIDLIDIKLDEQTQVILEKFCQLNLLNVEKRLNILLNKINEQRYENNTNNKNSLLSYIVFSIPIILSLRYVLLK